MAQVKLYDIRESQNMTSNWEGIMLRHWSKNLKNKKRQGIQAWNESKVAGSSILLEGRESQSGELM